VPRVVPKILSTMSLVGLSDFVTRTSPPLGTVI